MKDVMKRVIEKDLLIWRHNPAKMPLVLLGARQVGKTHTVFNFGKRYYQDVLVFNFENNNPLQAIFEQDAEPMRIISELENFSLKRITPDILIFFDEIQACPKALASLKYFTEKAPQYHIIAAGSLLGVAVNREGFSFPVGKVERLSMYPMNFEEFLLALGEAALADAIRTAYENDTPLPQNIHTMALNLYSIYLVTGGMPRAVLEYIEKKDFEFVRIIQRNILVDYEADMIKYSSPSESVKIRAVFASVPSQLAKENRKFQYSLIGSNARAATYEVGVQWLADAGLIYKCNKTNEGKIPLKSYIDLLSYKIYLNDIGLLNCYSNTPPALVLSGNFGGEAKGALTENYIMQQLMFNGLTPYYWESQGKAEIDFVLQLDDGIVVPIEAKSSIHTKSKSLAVFVKKYGIEKSIRISAKNFGFENGIKSVPLYAAFCI
jgi:predicted AAA+ superfamily ATPase